MKKALGITRFFRKETLRNMLLAAVFAGGTSAAVAQAVGLNFDNSTGMSSSQVWVQFLGGQQVAGQYKDIYGNSHDLNANTAYSVDQLSGGLDITGFSGRIYVSYGAYGLQGMENPLYTPAAATPTDPNFNTRYQYFETTIVPSGGGSGNTFYGDLSYIDFTSVSLSMQLKQSGTIVSNSVVANSNQVSSNGQALVNKALSSASIPTQAVLPNGASTSLPNNQFGRVISPQYTVDSGSGSVYPSFQNYLNSLSGTTVNIAGTFVGTGAQPSGSQTTTAQTYYYTASFSGTGPSGTLTLTANANISGRTDASWLTTAEQAATGIGGTSVITMNYSDLLAPEGIYGNNPVFTVVSGVNTGTYSGITNDIYGRVIGDVLAGLSLGYIGSEVQVSGTSIGNMASSAWWASGEANTGLTYIPTGTTSSGALTYDSITWQQTAAGQGYQFANTRNGDGFYNQYAGALAEKDPLTGNPYTTGYGFPLQDRLGNNLLSYGTADPRLVGAYLQITINPDGATPIKTGIWSGSSGSWGTASNWSGSAVPANDATVQFSGTTGGTVNTGTNRSTAGIYFNYYAGEYVITGNSITLSGDIINSSLVKQTIESDLVLGTDAVVFAAFGDLELNGDIALSNSGSVANTLTVSGTKTTTINGVVSNGTAPDGSIVKNGSGTLALNGANTFTGGVNHQEGTLVIGNNQAAGTGLLSFGNTNSKLTTVLSSGSYALANQVALNGDVLIGGTNALTFNGNTAITGTNPVLRTVTNTTDVAFNGVISQQTTGSIGSSFTKAGSGTMTLGGSQANTFTGSLSVNEGTLILAKTSGTAFQQTLNIGDGKGAANSAVAQWAASNQSAANFSSTIAVNTDGQLNLGSYSDSIATLIMYGGSVVGSGTLNLGAPSSQGVVNFFGTGSSSATIGSGVNFGGAAGNTFYVNNTFADVDLRVTGVVTGSNITKAGGGVLVLENNQATGSLTIAEGILAAHNLPNAELDITGGALSAVTGTSQTINTVNVKTLSVSGTGGGFILGLGSGTSSDSINVTETAQGSATFAASSAPIFFFSDKGMSESSPVTFTILTANSSVWVTGSNATTPNADTLMFLSTDIDGLTGSFSFSTSGGLKFTGTRGVSTTWSTTAGSGDWGTGGNWTGGSVAAAGSNILFGASTTTAVSTSTTRSVGSLTFSSGAPAYNLSGSPIILSGSLTNASTNLQTIGNELVINGRRTINAAAGDIALAGISLSPSEALPGVLTFTGSANTSVSGPITDGLAPGGSVIMQGTGTLALSGSNNFTGSLIFGAGAVQVSNMDSLGNTTILDFQGGALRTTASGTIIPAHPALILSSTGIFDVSGTGNTLTIARSITGPGTLVKTGSGTLLLPTLGDTVNSYEGGTIVNQGILAIQSDGSLGGKAVGTVVNNGATLFLDSSGTALSITGRSLTITGTGAGGTGAIYIGQGGNTTAWSGTIGLGGDASIFADSGALFTVNGLLNTGSNALTISTSGTSSSYNAATVTLGGVLSGSGVVNKTGLGTLIAQGASGSSNAFTGTINHQQGVINVLTNTALGTGDSSVTVSPGATLKFGSQASTGMQVAFDTITISGTGGGLTQMGAINNSTSGTNTLNSAIALADFALIYSQTGQLEVTGPINLNSNTLELTTMSAPMILSGAITGSGGLSTVTLGTFQITGSNSFSGGVAIGNGTGLTAVTAANSYALGTGTVAINNSTLNLQGAVSGTTTTPINIANTVTITGDGSINNLSSNNTLSGNVILNSNAIIQSTNGTLNLSGAVVGTGGLSIVTTGTGFGGAEVYLSGTTNASLINVTSGIFSSGNLEGTQINVGAGTLGSSPAIYSPAGSGTPQNVALHQLAVAPNGSLMYDISGTNSDSITLGQAQSFNNLQLLVNNTGMSGTNTYTLIALSSTASGAIGLSGTGAVVYSSGTYNSYLTTGTIGGGGVPNAILLQVSEGYALWDDGAGDGQWNSANNWATSGPGGAFVPLGGSAVAFTASNSTIVQTGGNQSVGGLAFAPGAAPLTIAGSTISTYGNIVNQSSGTQTITSNVTLMRNITADASAGNLVFGGTTHLGANTLTVTGSHNTTITGPITGNSGSTALVKSGSGTLRVTGTSTFTGKTEVDGGTFAVDGVLAAGNSVDVNSGGVLAGSGTIAGPVTVGENGTLSPGNSPGNLSTGSQTWLENGNYNWQVHDATGLAGVGFDTITITGQLNLSGILADESFAINLWSLSGVRPDVSGDALNFDSSEDHVWIILTTTAGIVGFEASDFIVNTVALNGTDGFSNAYEGVFSVRQVGNNLVLEYNSVPEPATGLLLLGSALALYATSRRRSRRS